MINAATDRRTRIPTRWLVAVVAVMSLLAGGLLAPMASAAEGGGRIQAAMKERKAATQAYVQEFWPAWLSYHQTQLIPANQLIGPNRISPIYQGVVAINNDTLYASTPINLPEADGPVILTIPETDVNLSYSVLNLTTLGDVFESGVPGKSAGESLPTTVYALVPQGYTGDVPLGAVQIEMPEPITIMIFRVDRYSGTVDMTTEGDAFRRSILMEPLNEYDPDNPQGATRILPEAAFSVPFKTLADVTVRRAPIRYLRGLQEAVQSANTPTLTPRQQQISDRFDAVFGPDGDNVNRRNRVAFARGARTAHTTIQDNYLDNRDANNWIHFTDIGQWDDDDQGGLNRSSIAEFIQWGNGISTAAYYHAFRDGRGKPLKGRSKKGYTLTFPANEQPPHERFWSLTAYTPNSIELIRNPIDKYLVASYTPGLEANDDGSITIHVARKKPRGVAEANWLPVSKRTFNVMLRIYGVPEGSPVADNTYVPPAMERVKRR